LADYNSATVIEDIRAHCAGDEEMGVAYFYVNGNTQSSLDCECLHRTLLGQLACQKSDLSGTLKSFYETHTDGDFRSHGLAPRLNDFSEALRKLVNEFEHVYLIIDAVDECGDTLELRRMTNFIKEIQGWKNGKSHLLLTSRGVEQFRECFKLPRIVRIRLNAITVNPDIRRTLHAWLSEDPRISLWPQPLRMEIETTLMLQVQGM
jgi:hypothetical protein